ncbi:hypothetical protein GCM10029992_51340 [Glycomyces albus]
MRLADRRFDAGVAVAEVVGDLVLVADTEIAQSERLGMAEFGPFGTPIRLDGTVRELDQVEDVLDIGLHLVLGNGLRTARQVLAAYAGGDHRQRTRPGRLAQFKVLEVADLPRLVVAPQVRNLDPFVSGPYRVLPVVHVGQSETVGDASSGEADETRCQLPQCSEQVRPECQRLVVIPDRAQ